MSYEDSFWNKYLVRSDQIIEFDTVDYDETSKNIYIDIECKSNHDLILVNQMLDSKDQVSVLYDWSSISLIDLWKSIQTYFQNDYQMIHKIHQKQKEFKTIKSITAYYQMTYKK
jgi:hypothetical protein